MRATVEIDGPAVMARVHKVIDDGRRFYEELLERNDVLRVRGHARFRDGALVVGDDEGGGETVLRGVPTVLAVGARPWIAPMPGVRERLLPHERRPPAPDGPPEIAGRSAAPARSPWSSRRP